MTPIDPYERVKTLMTLVLLAGLILLVLLAAAASTPRVPEPSSTTTLARADIGAGYQVLGNAADVTYQGIIGYADESYGPLYLAIPDGPGYLATVCGPAACLERTSTDAGPDLAMQRDGRIADVSSVDFETICGVSTRLGLCPGSVTISRRPSITLPPTDVE